jgi:hypothetical protein
MWVINPLRVTLKKPYVHQSPKLKLGAFMYSYFLHEKYKFYFLSFVELFKI